MKLTESQIYKRKLYYEVKSSIKKRPVKKEKDHMSIEQFRAKVLRHLAKGKHSIFIPVGGTVEDARRGEFVYGGYAQTLGFEYKFYRLWDAQGILINLDSLAECPTMVFRDVPVGLLLEDFEKGSHDHNLIYAQLVFDQELGPERGWTAQEWCQWLASTRKENPSKEGVFEMLQIVALYVNLHIPLVTFFSALKYHNILPQEIGSELYDNVEPVALEKGTLDLIDGAVLADEYLYY